MCDRAVVLKDGRVVGAARMSECNRSDLVRMMVGRDVEEIFPGGVNQAAGTPLLELRGLCNDKVSEVSLTVRAGGIVGLSGLVGAGRTEVAQTLFGLRPLTGGWIRVAGTPYSPRNPKKALDMGLAMATEERRSRGWSSAYRSAPICRSQCCLGCAASVS